MPDYDSTQYDPPAPLAHVTLRNISGGPMSPAISLLLDTGADITLLPRSAVETLGIKYIPESTYELIGFDGNKSVAQAVELDMIFLDRAYRGKYLLIDNENGVMGRDVLASVALLFDGPRQHWSQQDPE